ncbi:MAG TPA: NAD(P)/FAD-dependent oxidoreductase [Allosphingosinicella sp.]|jgi:tryptophan 2-monooxygenase
MPIIGNMRSSTPNALQDEAPPVPLTFVDTPSMDYAGWLNDSPIGSFTNPGAYNVAVIGSGGAGLAAAYELLRCGLSVALFEATDRIGGRLFASPSSSGSGNLFEMGAMRFTPSERLLHYYSNLFNATGVTKIVFDDENAFPDPGDQDLTYVAFQGKTYVHVPKTEDLGFPPSYYKVSQGWGAFVENGFKSADGSIQLPAMKDLTIWLTDPKANAVAIHSGWQAYLNAFSNSSLFEAMVRIFTDANAPQRDGSPDDPKWQPIDFEFFGALGTGFGGFGPLFPIGFLDIVRFVVNAVDSDQHELLTGTGSIVQGFLDAPIALPDGSTTTVRGNLHPEMPVRAITPQSGGKIRLDFETADHGVFDRVVVATSHRSMELTMGLGFGGAGQPLAESTADAIRRVHLENSSKVFVETSAFWTQANPHGELWPRNVVGDTILRNLYALTYPNAPADSGALLFSYTWADDSVKQQTLLDPQARLDLLLRDLQTISPDFAVQVSECIDRSTAQVIDWQNERYFFGAFKLNQPGQDPLVQTLFYDFQKAGTGADTGVYIAGDSIGFLGGWLENALQTGVNAAAGVVKSLGGTLTNEASSPFTMDPNLYDYSPDPVVATLARGDDTSIEVHA